MGFHAFVALATIILIFVTIQLRRRTPTDLLFLGGLVFVTLCGVITPTQALEGFSSPAILTIGSLLVCAAGLRNTGVLDWLGHLLLGTAHSEQAALRRLGLSMIATSAFVLNTALVAMFMPVMIDWCRKRNVSPSRMLIPVSYFAILGGVCTLVGTSTTIVANTILEAKEGNEKDKLVRIQRELENADRNDAAEIARLQKKLADQDTFVERVRPMSLFEIGRVGLPCAIVGALVLITIGPRLMPDRRDIVERHDTNRREYLVEMLVQPDCRLINQTVENAGLRQLPGLFLIEINRGTDLITPVNPKDTIRANDRLVFTGIVSTIVDLEKIPGLVPATELPLTRQNRMGSQLTEVVLSPSCPLIGSTVRDGLFRQRYNAAIVAIHRNGVRLTHKIGDIELESGDTLLLQTRVDFVNAYRHSRDFYLVGGVESEGPRRHDRAIWAGVLGLLLVAWLSVASFLPEQGILSGFSSHAVAALTIALVIVVTRCLPVASARNAIDLPLLLTIAGAIGLGNAIDASGADDAIAGFLVNIVGDNPMLLLIIIYILAMVFTEMITNNAVATTLLPLAIATAWQGGYNPRPFIMAIVTAASLAFLTPIGYQTNLMIMGPGGYRPSDFLRVGLPVAFAVAVTALTVIPMVWSF
jgi:di/tricarboxylate transporter